MPLPNSENPRKGKEFEVHVASVLAKKFGKSFSSKKIPIGLPPKAHSFDLVSTDDLVAVECKNYAWTEGGNVPSAKMAFVNEAVFYLQHLSPEIKKYIVMRKDFREKKTESLAEYYFRTYSHLLDGVGVMEFDIETGNLTILGGENIPYGIRIKGNSSAMQKAGDLQL